MDNETFKLCGFIICVCCVVGTALMTRTLKKPFQKVCVMPAVIVELVLTLYLLALPT